MPSASECKKLSIEQCRKYLKNCEYTDEQVEEIRDSLYQLANVLVDDYLNKKEKDKCRAN